ncbi:MAG: four helix bundle protein [Deltaproteobacteria bacterium]|nr:four helix bundle protein [Deltaproteobacteria bacterium]
MWERSHRLTLRIYEITAAFPKEELYGLTSQIRRSCAAIAANIAEGCGKDGDAEFARYLQIARGSASELEYHLLLEHDLNFLGSNDYEDLHNETNGVKQMLTSFIKKLKA